MDATKPALLSILVEQGGETKTWLLPNVKGISVDVSPEPFALALYCVAFNDEHGVPCYEHTETTPDPNIAPDDDLRKTMDLLRVVYGIDALEDCLDWIEEHADEPQT